MDIGALYGTDGDAYARTQTALVDAVTSSGVFVAVGMPDSERLDERANFLLRLFDWDRQRASLSIKRSAPNSDRMSRLLFDACQNRFSHLQYFDIVQTETWRYPICWTRTCSSSETFGS